MSWFAYGNPENHKDQVGVWLRAYSNPDITEKIKKSKNKRFFDTLGRTTLYEYNEEKNLFWIEVRCKNIIDVIRRKHRYNVFYVTSEPNPEWVCEGDLGKGLEN